MAWIRVDGLWALLGLSVFTQGSGSECQVG